MFGFFEAPEVLGTLQELNVPFWPSPNDVLRARETLAGAEASLHAILLRKKWAKNPVT